MTRRRNPGQGALFEAEASGGARVRRVRRGVDTTIGALRSTGRLEPVDAAMVAMARTLADAMDDERADVEGSAFTVATIAGRLHPIVEGLRGERIAGFDDLDDLLAGMAADAIELGDAEPATPAEE